MFHRENMIAEDNKVHLDFINALSKSKIKKRSVIKLNDSSITNTNLNKVNDTLYQEETKIVTEENQSDDKEIDPDNDYIKTSINDNYYQEFENIFKSFDETSKTDTNDGGSDEDVHEKKEVLYHLLRDYKDDNRGQWSMNTPLYELKYELKKRKSEETELDNIAFIKQILVVVLHLVEFGNNKLGLLNLNGWANHVCSNLDQYKRSLRAIHLQYFRNRVSNPISELGWMIAGSMIMFHFTNANGSSPAKANEQPNNQKNAPSSSKIDLGSIIGVMSKFL